MANKVYKYTHSDRLIRLESENKKLKKQIKELKEEMESFKLIRYDKQGKQHQR